MKRMFTITGVILSFSLFGQKEGMTTQERSKKAYEFTYRAQKLMERGQFKTAYAFTDSAIYYYPEDRSGYYNRGLCKSNLENYKGAISDFNIAIRLSPNEGVIYYDRAVAYFNSGDKANACEDLKKSQQLGVPVDKHMTKAACK